MPLVKRRTPNEQDSMIPTAADPMDNRRSRRPAHSRYDEPDAIPIVSSRSKSQIRQPHSGYDEPDSLLLSRDTPNPRSSRNRYDEPLADSLIPSPTKANKRSQSRYEDPDILAVSRSQGEARLNPPRYEDSDVIPLGYDEPEAIPIVSSRSKSQIRQPHSGFDEVESLLLSRDAPNARSSRNRYDEPLADSLIPSPSKANKRSHSRYDDPDVPVAARIKEEGRIAHTRYDDAGAIVPTRTRNDGRMGHSRHDAPDGTTVSTRTGSEAVTRLGSSSTHVTEDLPRRREPPPPPQPTTPEEQYWAARAIHAEALLSAKSQHAADLKRAGQIDEARRQKDVRAIRTEAAERLQRLERLIIILATIVLVLTAALSYTLLPQGQKQELKSWWSMPHHITIPILSPFASVVEQETGILSSRVILACVPFLAVLTFAIARMIWQSFHVKRVD